MTVKDLVGLLSDCPPGAKVVVEAGLHAYRETRLAGPLRAERCPDGVLCKHYGGCEMPGAKIIDVVVVG